MFKGKTVTYTLGCKLNFSESSTISRQLNEISLQKLNLIIGKTCI